MSASLSSDPVLITEFPYAVRTASGFTHFKSKPAANLFADLMDNRDGNLMRYVANLDTFEWHAVSEFRL